MAQELTEPTEGIASTPSVSETLEAEKAKPKPKNADFKPAKGEEKLFVVDIYSTQDKFDPKTGAKIEGLAKRQVLTPREWELIKNNAEAHAYNFEIIYQPK
jgi:hypothetical protein